MYGKATRYAETLRADDPRFRHAVHIIHEEGTVFFLRYSFLMVHTDECGEEWVIVISEHQGTHVFSAEDLLDYRQWQYAGDPEPLPEID